MRLGAANAIAFVAITRQYDEAERIAFVRAFLATVSGLSQQAIGHGATADAFNSTAALKPAGGAHPLQ